MLTLPRVEHSEIAAAKHTDQEAIESIHPSVPATVRRPPQRARSSVVLPLCLAVILGLTGACGDTSSVRTSLGTPAPKLSARQLDRKIEALYQDDPRAHSFVVQDVEYTMSSLETVLRACTTPAKEVTAQAGSAHLLACAPLIFFLYSFGRRDSVPQALELADQLYNYALSETRGSLDAASVLGGLLRSWRIPVSQVPPLRHSSPGNAEALSLVAESSKAIISEGSVHVLIEGYSHRGRVLVETISADVGRAISEETLVAGQKQAAIKLTSKAAFLHGNAAGLSSLLGLPAPFARHAGTRWVEFPRGTSEYLDLAAEDTIDALPTSILPLSVTSTRLIVPVLPSRPHVLTWTAHISRQSTPLTETLTLAPGKPLPIRETTVAGSEVEVATFSQWGHSFTVQVPPQSQVVPYTLLGS